VFTLTFLQSGTTKTTQNNYLNEMILEVKKAA